MCRIQFFWSVNAAAGETSVHSANLKWPSPIPSNCRIASRSGFCMRTDGHRGGQAAGLDACAGHLAATRRAICRRRSIRPSVGGDFWARSRGLKFLRYVHRLDADTSGVLLFAKSVGAVEMFLRLFENRRMEKTYLAVVAGEPSEKEWTCRAQTRAGYAAQYTE